MQRIIVLNPKGGSGKTTIASNLAACYAANGERPALMDLDSQGSSMRWLRKRPDNALPDLTRGADAVLVPVIPSEIDIHAAAKCIADLLLVAKIRRSQRRIGIIANRVRGHTRVSQALTRFLSSLDIPLVTTL